MAFEVAEIWTMISENSSQMNDSLLFMVLYGFNLSYKPFEDSSNTSLRKLEFCLILEMKPPQAFWHKSIEEQNARTLNQLSDRARTWIIYCGASQTRFCQTKGSFVKNKRAKLLLCLARGEFFFSNFFWKAKKGRNAFHSFETNTKKIPPSGGCIAQR